MTFTSTPRPWSDCIDVADKADNILGFNAARDFEVEELDDLCDSTMARDAVRRADLTNARIDASSSGEDRSDDDDDEDDDADDSPRKISGVILSSSYSRLPPSR
jgi:hypothetical protein